MLKAFAGALGVWAAFGLAAAAQETMAGAGHAANPGPNPVIVELYTSQGCSSCPPADAFLAELARQPGVLPLALHVDYWDYIGWRDVFAQPRFTARQKAYARAVKSRTIYTPQMIVDGVERVEGNDPQAVAAAIAQAAGRSPSMQIALTRVSGGLQVKVAPPSSPPPAPFVVQLVRLMPEATVHISHGENAGHTLTYHNIVTSWDPVAEWTGVAPLDLVVPITGEGPAVVIVQQAGPAEIVAAAQLR